MNRSSAVLAVTLLLALEASAPQAAAEKGAGPALTVIYYYLPG
jgi:phosphate-selective porin